jgi:phytoene/squalene synthetase
MKTFLLLNFYPKKSKNAIITIYAFARIGDDIADAENLSAREKQSQLKKNEISIRYDKKKLYPKRAAIY